MTHFAPTSNLAAFIARPGVRTAALVAAFAVPAAAFARIAVEIGEQATFASESTILHWIHSFSTPFLDTLIPRLTNLAGVDAIALGTLTAAASLYLARRRRESLLVLAGVGGALAINLVLKMSFHRLRPSLWPPLVQESNYSFPSGHSMLSSALALSLVVALWHTRFRWLAIVLGALYIALIGFTRLYLGVHYPTDVAGGWLASLLWVMALAVVYQRARR